MTKRKKISAVVATIARPMPLPSNPESLAHLLRTGERLAEYFGPILFREQQRRDAWAATSHPDFDREWFVRVLSALGRGSTNQLAVDRPSLEPIVPYLEPAIEAEFAVLNDQSNEWPPFDGANPLSDIGRPAIRVLDGHIRAMERILAIVHALRERIVERLDEASNSFCNTPKRKYKKYPSNPTVLRIANEINADKDQEHSQVDIVMELVDCTEPEARSLIAQAGRAGLLEPRRRKRKKVCNST